MFNQQGERRVWAGRSGRQHGLCNFDLQSSGGACDLAFRQGGAFFPMDWIVRPTLLVRSNAMLHYGWFVVALVSVSSMVFPGE